MLTARILEKECQFLDDNTWKCGDAFLEETLNRETEFLMEHAQPSEENLHYKVFVGVVQVMEGEILKSCCREGTQ